MPFIKIPMLLAFVLALSGCLVGSKEPLVARNESLPVLPSRTEGYLKGDDGKDRRIVIDRKRGDSHYRVTLPDDKESKPFDLVVFDVGSDRVYGIQAAIDGIGLYGLIRPYSQNTIQIRLLQLDLEEETLDGLGVRYLSSDRGEITVLGRQDLDTILRHAARTRSYSVAYTIRTQPGGFANAPDRTPAFDTTGYAAADLLAVIYSGKTTGAKAFRYSPYLLEFATALNQIDGDPPCLRLFTQRVRTQLPFMATGRGIEIIAGDLYETHKNATGGRDRAFIEGMVGGAESFAALAAMTLSARQDAAMFYRRHGCASTEARRFFENFNRFVVAK